MKQTTTKKQKTKGDLFASLVTDFSDTCKRVAKNHYLVEALTKAQLTELTSRLQGYNPVTENGKRNKQLTIQAIDRAMQLNGHGKPLPNSLIQAPKNFDLLQAGGTVLKETCVLEFHVKGKGFGKKVDSHSFLEQHGNAGGIDPNRIHMLVQTIDPSEISDLTGHTAKFKTWLKSRCVPSKLLAPGFYLLPLKLLTETDEAIIEFAQERERILDRIEERYPRIIENAKERLGVSFDQANYPPFRELRSYFKIEARYISFNVAAAVENVNKEIYQRELEKAQLKWADTAEEIKLALRGEMLNFVSTFADKLGYDEDTGRRKVFHAQRIKDLQDFLGTFENRNFLNDTELAELAKQAKELLIDVDVEKIRSNDDFRTSLEDNFNKIKEKAEKMITVQGRKFKFVSATGGQE